MFFCSDEVKVQRLWVEFFFFKFQVLFRTPINSRQKCITYSHQIKDNMLLSYIILLDTEKLYCVSNLL